MLYYEGGLFVFLVSVNDITKEGNNQIESSIFCLSTVCQCVQ